MSLVKAIFATTKVEEDDWCRTTIFQTLVICGPKAKKLVIDGGSYMNIVFSSTVEHHKLPIEPHRQPYMVAWIMRHQSK